MSSHEGTVLLRCALRVLWCCALVEKKKGVWELKHRALAYLEYFMSIYSFI